METKDVVKQWKKELSSITDTNITVEAYSMVSAMMGSENDYQVNLQSTDYDALKEVSDNCKSDQGEGCRAYLSPDRRNLKQYAQRCYTYDHGD